MTDGPKRAPGSGTITHRGGDRYLLRVVDAFGKRRAKTVRALDDADARKKLDALVGVLEESGQGAAGGTTLRGWWNEWIRRQEIDGARSGSVTAYRSRWENTLSKAPFVDDLLANVTTGDLRTFLRSLLAHYESPRSAGAAFALVRVLFRDAVEEGLIEKNLARDVAIPRKLLKVAKKRRNPLPREQATRVAGDETLIACDRAMILTALFGCLRAGEVHAMPLRNVYERDGLLMLRVEFGGYGGKPTKSGEIRDVPILGAGRAALEAWLQRVPRDRKRNPEMLLFPGRRGGRRALAHASKWLRFRLSQIGIDAPTFRFHDLRHTGAEALENGWFGATFPREHLQVLLGHATITQTEEYSGGALAAMLGTARAFSGPRLIEAPQDAREEKDQAGISEATSPIESATIQPRSERSGRRRPCSSGNPSPERPGGPFDPTEILRAGAAQYVADVASGRVTPADSEAFLDAVIATVTPAQLDAIEARREGGRFLNRRALAVAEKLLERAPTAATRGRSER